MYVILITGCSSGFGLLTAARLATSGHTVYASMRDLGKQEALLAEVSTRGGEVRVIQLDVTDRQSIEAAIERIEQEQGRLDVVVNNAGYGIGGFFEELSEAEIREQFDTNFFGAQAVTRAALPLLRRTAAQSEHRTKVINISSIQGLAPLPLMGAYCASKFALEGFSEGLHFELQPFGVDVVLVEPGAFKTAIFAENRRMASRMGADASPYTRFGQRLLAMVEGRIASGRGAGDAEDVARLIERIINQPRPRLRYLIGASGRLRYLLRSILPFKWYRRLVLHMAYGPLQKTTQSNQPGVSGNW